MTHISHLATPIRFSTFFSQVREKVKFIILLGLSLHLIVALYANIESFLSTIKSLRSLGNFSPAALSVAQSWTYLVSQGKCFKRGRKDGKRNFFAFFFFLMETLLCLHRIKRRQVITSILFYKAAPGQILQIYYTPDVLCNSCREAGLQ